MSHFTLENNPYLLGKTLLIDKPYGKSSFYAVAKTRGILKKHFNLKKIKVGHAGTLDPLATGLLVVCTGKHTKTISHIQDAPKRYTATLKFGATTASYDRETEEENCLTSNPEIDISILQENLKAFEGDQMQVPTIFSAIKQNGEALYKKARRGESVEVSPRPIHIYSIELVSLDWPLATIDVRCSKGTYIRSLAHDIGKQMERGAYLYDLRRTEIGEYHVKDAIAVDDLEATLTKS